MAHCAPNTWEESKRGMLWAADLCSLQESDGQQKYNMVFQWILYNDCQDHHVQGLQFCCTYSGVFIMETFAPRTTLNCLKTGNRDVWKISIAVALQRRLFAVSSRVKS